HWLHHNIDETNCDNPRRWYGPGLPSNQSLSMNTDDLQGTTHDTGFPARVRKVHFHIAAFHSAPLRAARPVFPDPGHRANAPFCPIQATTPDPVRRWGHSENNWSGHNSSSR